MALNIEAQVGTKPSPRFVDKDSIVQQARTMKNPQPERAAGVTIPRLTVNQTKLQYDTLKQKGQVQFRFNTGTLLLVLQQSVQLSNDLSTCAQEILAEHELGHVEDNQAVMKRMEREIKSSRPLQDIFFTPQWRPKSSFNAVQAKINTTVGDIFKSLTQDAVKKRDTESEYQRIQTRIQKCETQNKPK